MTSWFNRVSCSCAVAWCMVSDEWWWVGGPVVFQVSGYPDRKAISISLHILHISDWEGDWAYEYEYTVE